MRQKPFLSHPSGWLNTNKVCALSDSERHLGHVVFDRNLWKAFDATHLDEPRTGFLCLGTFTTVDSAKAAVEGSVASSRTPVTRAAGTRLL
jgi:hypothetical protein